MAASRTPSKLSLGRIGLPVGVLVIVGTILLPLPPLVLDVLLAANFAASLMLVLVVLFSDAALGLTAFPSILLFTTVYRLAVNVASTRLILGDGHAGTHAAGRVIEALGGTVVAGNFLVGVIIFGVIVVIQYVVINHGSVRISEVSARFVLDAMPGKQMSIDADLNAGIIDEMTARDRRLRVSKEAEFYGAMDGAIRFTQRDAVAGILIVAINIVGGFVVGVAQRGMDVGVALRTFTTLTIGDGLANAVSSLLVSVAAALLTTRASAESELHLDLAGQLLRSPAPLWAGGGVLTVLALAPGLPTLSFLTLGVGLALLARRATRNAAAAPATTAIGGAGGASLSALGPAPPAVADSVEKLVTVDRLAIELGFELLQLVGGPETGLPQRLKALRRELASTIGIVLPTVRIIDNPRLASNAYAVLLKGATVASGELRPGYLLVVDSGLGRPLPAGLPARDPAFHLPAVWIKEAERAVAEAQGHMVIDPMTVLVTHFSETVKDFSSELLGRQELKALLDVVAESHPKVVEELTPKLLTLGEIQKVLAALLRERVPVRDLVTVLETLADAAPANRATPYLVEQTRLALRRSLVAPYLTGAGELHAVMTAPELEDCLLRAASGQPGAPPLPAAAEIIGRVQATLGPAAAGAGPVLVTLPPLRALLRAILEPYLRTLPVISTAELPPGVRVVSLGMVT